MTRALVSLLALVFLFFATEAGSQGFPMAKSFMSKPDFIAALLADDSEALNASAWQYVYAMKTTHPTALVGNSKQLAEYLEGLEVQELRGICRFARVLVSEGSTEGKPLRSIDFDYIRPVAPNEPALFDGRIPVLSLYCGNVVVDCWSVEEEVSRSPLRDITRAPGMAKTPGGDVDIDPTFARELLITRDTAWRPTVFGAVQPGTYKYEAFRTFRKALGTVRLYPLPISEYDEEINISTGGDRTSQSMRTNTDVSSLSVSEGGDAKAIADANAKTGGVDVDVDVDIKDQKPPHKPPKPCKSKGCKK